MRRHFRVDLTKDMSFWTLQDSSRRDKVMVNPQAVVQNSRHVTYRGSKSAKSARILSALPSSVHDSTDPSSGWINTMLNSFLARCRGPKGHSQLLARKKKKEKKT